MGVLDSLRNDPLYVARAGRKAYLVDFTHTSEYAVGERKRVEEGANCWSSESRLLPDMHLPCFDVDVDRSTLIAVPVGTEHHILWNSVEDIVHERIYKLCGDAEVRWVPSSTPGHHHVYVEYALEWEDYSSLLGALHTDGIIERGYLAASGARKATYVRMPGVLKEVKPEPEQLDFIDDNEPF